MDNSYFGEAERIWGTLVTVRQVGTQFVAGESAPQTLREWRTVFRQWAREYALYLAGHHTLVPKCSMVIHPPDDEEGGLNTVLLIVGMFHLGEPLDLDDPLAYTIWLDFLNDHPARGEYWEWWTKHQGEINYL